jgi:D-3-phosphoglycerate dehydrogenase
MVTTAKNIIAAVSPSFCQSGTLVRELEALGAPVILNKNPGQLEGESLVRFLRQADASIALIGKEKISDADLRDLPRLKAIAKYGVGTDNIDFPALERHQIRFGFTAGVNRLEVAEHVLGFTIGHFRRLINANTEMHRGIWKKNGGRDLRSLKIGIIGFGHVGTAVADLMAPFGPEISCCDIIDKQADARTRNVTIKTFDQIVAESDLITIHVPLTDKTAGMINAQVIAAMKPDALLINTARGEVVDFAAAVAAVDAGRLGGFAADVFALEPADLSSCAMRPNLYFTPHIAANSTGAVLKMGRSAIDWVRIFLTTES